MPSKIVLSVGQCRPDHAAISHFLTSNFDVQVLATDLLSDTVQTLRDHAIDLVLINRKLDADYSDGMEILKVVKETPETTHIPVMLVSNFADAQTAAVQAGATYGFGKSELNSPDSVERVRTILG